MNGTLMPRLSEERALLGEAWLPDWRTWLPLTLVVISLGSLLLAPGLMERRIRGWGEKIAGGVVPARTELGAVETALAAQVAAVHGFMLTGDREFRTAFDEAAAQEDRARTRLQSVISSLDEALAQPERDLQAASAAWRSGLDVVMNGQGTRAQVRDRLAARQRRLDHVLAAVKRLDEALVGVEGRLREQIRRHSRDQVRLTRALALLALLSVAAVGWLGRRLRRLARSLRYRIDDEVTLRKVARSLSAALTVREVAQQVASSALETARALGAYLELVRDGEVEVVAASGIGAPAVGLRVAFPGSLTEAIIRSRQPTVTSNLNAAGASMAPYLRESCRSCSGLAAPLFADEEVLGALVLLRSTGQPPFGAAETNHARALGDLVSAALRRVTLLEETERQRVRAEAAVRTRDEVLAIVSHDLRNPLNSVVMTAHILRQQDSRAANKRELDIVLRATDRMNRLIQDLLDVTRLEAGHGLALAFSEVDVAAVARESCEAHSAVAQARSQTLVCEIADDLPRVTADRSRLLQVLANLLGNALKFTPEGGRVTLGAEKAGAAVRLWVSDTGPGIPEESVPHLFDPFWQAGQTARLGAGLGLTISKGIVEAHGGRLWVQTSPGAGSTFFLTVPIEAAGAAAPELAAVQGLDAAGR